MEGAHNDNAPSRRPALTEINDSHLQETPKGASPDEMVIIQRGPRCKPETWSPLEFNKTSILAPSKDKTPEKQPRTRSEVSSKLRRRLNLSPTKRDHLGEELAKRLKSFPKFMKSDKD